MKKIIYIEPQGFHTPMLFDTFKETFENHGYVETTNADEADIAFVDLYSFVRSVNYSYVWARDIPMIFFDATDYGGMSKENPSYVWQFIENERTAIVFVRKMDKTKIYPINVYPYELIQYPDHDFPPVTKEELLNREYDICWIGNESPQRRNVVKGLQDSGFKMDVHWTNENGKLLHDEWLNRHRNAKMFLSADGGGFGDERIYQLGSIAAILKQRNNQLILNDFKDCVDCVKTDETAWFFYQRENSLFSTDWLYNIYLKGIEKLHTYYNAEYRAKYILSVLKENGL